MQNKLCPELHWIQTLSSVSVLAEINIKYIIIWTISFPPEFRFQQVYIYEQIQTFYDNMEDPISTFAVDKYSVFNP